MPNLAVATDVHLSSIDSSGNVSLALQGSMINGTTVQPFLAQTAFFSPTIANSRTAMTDALVAEYARQFPGQALVRASTVMPQFQVGL